MFKIKIDKNSIQHEGNYNLIVDDVPEFITVSDPSDILEFISDYVSADTPDWVEIILTDVDYEIIDSPVLLFTIDVEASLNYRITETPDDTYEKGVYVEIEHNGHEINTINVKEFKPYEFNLVGKGNTVFNTIHNELYNVSKLLEDNFHYEDTQYLFRDNIYGIGKYVNGEVLLWSIE